MLCAHQVLKQLFMKKADHNWSSWNKTQSVHGTKQKHPSHSATSTKQKQPKNRTYVMCVIVAINWLGINSLFSIALTHNHFAVCFVWLCERVMIAYNIITIIIFISPKIKDEICISRFQRIHKLKNQIKRWCWCGMVLCIFALNVWFFQFSQFAIIIVSHCKLHYVRWKRECKKNEHNCRCQNRWSHVPTQCKHAHIQFLLGFVPCYRVIKCN